MVRRRAQNDVSDSDVNTNNKDSDEEDCFRNNEKPDRDKFLRTNENMPLIYIGWELYCFSWEIFDLNLLWIKLLVSSFNF